VIESEMTPTFSGNLYNFGIYLFRYKFDFFVELGCLVWVSFNDSFSIVMGCGDFF
jgi:hypothetical protein